MQNYVYCPLIALVTIYNGNSQSVLSRSQGIRDQSPGDRWIHFCNAYFEVFIYN